MLYYLPLEHLDKRYTVEMDTLIQKELHKRSINYTKIDGVPLTTTIETGAFLDANSTNYFKFHQLQQICTLFAEKKIKNGDVFFLADIWFPGIEAIKYMALFANLTVKVGGISHAGSWTETDFVGELAPWVRDIEIGWFKMYDFVCVGSTWAKAELIQKGVVKYFRRLHVTGIPFDYQNVRKYASDTRQDIVVFTGRLHDEKQPWEFDWLAEQLPQYQFIKTMEQNLPKEAYYQLLGKSKLVFSSALQENFGFGVLEAVTLGCLPIVPNRLSYQELYPKGYRYETLSQAKEMITKYMDNWKDVATLFALPQQFNTSNVIDVVEKEL